MEIRYAYQEIHKIPEGFAVPEERTKPWGTSHAVLCAAEQIGDAPFAVINADDYYGKSAFKEIYDFLATVRDTDTYNYCMVGYQLGNTVTDNGSVARGVCQTDDKGYLIRVDERTRIEKFPGGIHYTEDDGATWTDLAPQTPVSMNMWGYTPSFLAQIKAQFPAFLETALATNPLKAEFYLPSMVTQLLNAKKATVKVLHTTDKWYGVTYAADKPQVVAALKAMAEAGEYPDGLWK
jgi:hypothetical protein